MSDVVESETFVAGLMKPGSTTERHSVEKVWSEDVLRGCYDRLELPEHVMMNGQQLPVGEVVNAEFDDELGIVVEMEIHDEEVIQKLDNGLCDFAPKLVHDFMSDGESREPPNLSLLSVGVYSDVDDECVGMLDVEEYYETTSMTMADYVNNDE